MRRFRSRAVAAVWLGVGYLVWVLLGIGGLRATHLATRAAMLVASAATAHACATAASRHQGTARKGWALLALTACCWLVSTALAAYQEVTAGQTLPVPSPADLPSALALVLPVLALLSFLHPALPSASRMRTLLDGLLMASSLLFAGWALVFEEAYRSSGDGPGRALALAYPVVDVVVLSLAIVTVLRVRRGSRLPWALLGTGLGLFVIAHGAFAYLEVARAYQPGGLDDFAWIAGCLLIGLAALAPDGTEMKLSAEPRAGGVAAVLVPYLPVLLAAAVGLDRQRQGGLSAFLVVNAAVVLVLLVARQLLAQFENLHITRELEKKVTTRTAELEREERRFRSLAQNASDVLTIVDARGVIRYQSPSVEHVLGYRFGELVGSEAGRLLHPEERASTLALLTSTPPPPAPPMAVERRLRRNDGSWCLAEITISNLLGDDAVEGIVLACRDIGERRALEDQLRHQALHDPLTGLGNRTLLRDRLEHALARAKRSPELVALLLLDLDGFKEVNDSFGHAVGDRLLVEVANRLTDSVRLGDTVARMGGDEFAVLIEQSEKDIPTLVAQRILYRLRAPVVIDGKTIVTQASVGVVSGSASCLNADDLLRNADLAMYQAKSKGKGVYEVYEPTMHSAAVQRVEIEGDLRRGLRERELILHYQPVVDLRTGQVSGAEALVRWPHPLRGMVQPGEFLPWAEESDLIVTLGRWVLGEACSQAARYRSLLGADTPFTMCVNIATRQLTSPLLVKEVEEALQRNQLRPSDLLLEITEGALMQEARQILPVLHALKALGVTLAIDDFGTGWSSLSRLRSFPVDKLKIDKSFVQEISSADEEAPLVSAIVAMAKSLRLSTLAEGVETAEQLAFLRREGCEEAQGFFMSKPVPASSFETLLSQPLPGLAPTEGQATPRRAADDDTPLPLDAAESTAASAAGVSRS